MGVTTDSVGFADSFGDVVEFVVCEVGTVARNDVDWRAAVIFETGYDVSVNVGDFLSGGRTVVERNYGRVGLNCGFDHRGKSVKCGENLICKVFRKVIESFVVLVWNNENVAGREWVRVEERGHVVVFENDTAGNLAGNDATERAVFVLWSHVFVVK